MRPLRWLLVGLAFLGILQSSLIAQPIVAPRESLPTSPIPHDGQSLKHLDGQKIVFVVDGAGASTMVYDRLLAVMHAHKANMHIHQVLWCNTALGTLRQYQDLASHARAAAWLAGQTKRLRNECPNAEIYYIGQSTGVRIALLAAEMAPARSVDRIILMAGVSSCTEDLRPALRASRSGIDNFWSPEDEVLDFASVRFGLPDGSKGRPCGLMGFHMPAWKDAEGFDAYKNLRQYRWSEQMAGTGGHFAWTTPLVMKRYIVPLIAEPQAAPSRQPVLMR